MGRATSAGVREYLLTDFDADYLVPAILRPTRPSRSRTRRRPPFEQVLVLATRRGPEAIARGLLTFATARQDSVLPLVQVVCTQLHERVRTRPDGERMITLDDFTAMHGVEGGIRTHVKALLARLVEKSPADQPAFVAIFCKLYVRQSDGTLTTALLPEDDLRGVEAQGPHAVRRHAAGRLRPEIAPGQFAPHR